MSDGYGYDPYGRRPEIIGYDEYGRPVHRTQEMPPETPPEGAYPGQEPYPYPAYDPYAQAPGQQAGHDPYPGRPQQQGGHPGHQAPHPQQGAPYAGTQPRQAVPYPEAHPQQHQQPVPYPEADSRQADRVPAQGGPSPQEQPPHGGGGGREEAAPAGEEDGYRTEQFSFVEETSDDSEDVIDWLKFTESRTERREEAKRRGRNRGVALVVVLALLLVGGTGWAWYAGLLPGTGDDGGTGGAAAGEQRDVIVLHLREQGGASSTALLVDNEGAGEGSTLLLPNALAVSAENGSTTTLGKSVQDRGAGPTRDALNTLLGSDIKGTWRLDTPFLENLVELVGGITLDTDTTVPGAKRGAEPQVEKGGDQDLDGRAAVAYATYRARSEPQTAQLARFGQVMQALLKKVSADASAATRTVESLGQIPDPSLSEAQLGSALAALADRARQGDYRTRTLPVRADGTLGRQAGDRIVKKVLGGSVKNSDPDAVPRVSLKNASGRRGLDGTASAALVNGGYTVVKAGTGTTRATSLVTYAEPAREGRGRGDRQDAGSARQCGAQGRGGRERRCHGGAGRRLRG